MAWLRGFAVSIFATGDGRRWLSGSRALSLLVGGWSIGGVHRYQSGYPLPVYMTNALPIFNLYQRPDLVAGQSPSSGIANGSFNPSQDRIINLDAFATPAPYTFGNTPRALDDLRQFPAPARTAAGVS